MYRVVSMSLKLPGVPCRCFWMTTTWELAHHLNLVRQNQTDGKIRRIPDVGYNMFRKNFEAPSLDEGFSAVERIDLLVSFDSPKDEVIFKQWTTAGH